MEDLIEVMRRESAHTLGGYKFKGTLVTTGYDPDKHAVKGIFVPQEIESGWIPIAVIGAGGGYGVVTGPKVGTKDDMAGDQFEIEFAGGDHNTPVAKMKQFSNVDKPPRVESGETLIKDAMGNSIYMKKDGSRVDTHPQGGTITWGADGKLTYDTNNKDITYNSGTGKQVFNGGSGSNLA